MKDIYDRVPNLCRALPFSSLPKRKKGGSNLARRLLQALVMQKHAKVVELEDGRWALELQKRGFQPADRNNLYHLLQLVEVNKTGVVRDKETEALFRGATVWYFVTGAGSAARLAKGTEVDKTGLMLTKMLLIICS